jgi:N-acetylglutamate synthase
VRIRPLVVADIPDALSIWESTGITLTFGDDAESLARCFARNPNTSLGGEIDGQLVATAMGTWDGRRGYLWHLAVKPELQGRGLGRKMLVALETAYRELGIPKVTFQIETSNREVLGFYLRMGYHTRDDLVCVSKVLAAKEER